MAPVRRFLPPLLLAAATAAAAAWWAVEAVHVPAKVRRDLSAGLGSWFPGGVRFRSASRIGPRAYRMLDFEAFPSGSDRPWLTAASVELVQSEDGSRIERLRLGSPLLRLGGGPSLLPAGAFRMAPGTTGALPEVEAVGGTLLAALPGGRGAAVPVARNLALRFAPAAGVEGSFDSPVGTFRLQGPFDPSGRSSLRASSDRIEVPEGSPVRAVAGPVETRGRSSGAVTLSFGGGEPAVLTGTLSVQELELGEGGVRFSGALAVVRGREGPGGFALDAELRAAGVSAGGLSAERASLSLPGLSTAAMTGEAALWRGKLEFRAAPGPAGGIEGTVEGADLALMPPGFLGAATPSRGALDARFAWGGGALEGSFEARDAELWNLPAFSGIRRLVPGVGRQEGLFRTAKGRFRSAGGVTDLPALELDGSGFGMSLARPGRVGPARKLDLDFELRLQRDDRSGEGLPPLRTLVDALGRALWKPIGKYFLFHVRIGGTLDAPTHELVAPLGLGK